MTNKSEGFEVHLTTRLWRDLATMRIEPDGADLGFLDRLAIENSWSRPRAAAVFEEYRRFLYMAAVASHPVTPSEDVDQAWHLHLTYSRHYWDVLCASILRRPLHHDPTAGGSAEADRHLDQYQRTLATYRLLFRCEPPADIWPDGRTRFATRHMRVDASRYLLIPRSRLRWSGIGAAAALASACSAADGGAATIAAGIVIGVALILLAAAASVLWTRSNGRRRGDGGCGAGGCGSSRGSDDSGAGCGGGCGGD